MSLTWILIVAGLALGTHLMRRAGPWIGRGGRISGPFSQRLFEIAPVVCLFSLALLATLLPESSHGDGPSVARWLGVALAGVLVWRRTSMLSVVLCAAVATALLRLAGLG